MLGPEPSCSYNVLSCHAFLISYPCFHVLCFHFFKCVVEIFISLVFCHYLFYDDWCIAIFIDVLSSIMWCIVIHFFSCLGFALLHLWVALLILTCVLSVQGTLDELSLLCVPLYLWDTTSLLVRLIWSHLHELHLHFCMLCLSCIVLQALYVVVSATHHLWFIFTLELSCLCQTLWFLIFFPLLVLSAWIWVSFLFSCFYYGYLSVRYLSHPIYLFQHFTAYLGLGLCAGSPH